MSPDGAVAGCMRQDRGAFKIVETGLGMMFLHRLHEDRMARRQSWASIPSSNSRPALASVDHRHAVYTAFLESMELSKKHAIELRERRGLSKETVTRNLYASVPTLDQLSRIVGALATIRDFTAVPGFVRTREWQSVCREGELLIPVRDSLGRVQAICRGTGGVGGAPKYLWLSGRGGASCGAPPHHAWPDVSGFDPIIVTEGILKADVIAERLHCSVIGLAGIGSLPQNFGDDLRRLYPGVNAVRVAPDADERTNPAVRRAAARLVRALKAARFMVTCLRWDRSAGKGLDDVLNGGAE